MRVTRKDRVGAGFGIAPWIVAGALLLGASASATAQDATPPPAEAGTETTAAADDTQGGGGGGRDTAAPVALPATGVGLATIGGGGTALAVGATVSGALVGAAALRRRFTSQ